MGVMAGSTYLVYWQASALGTLCPVVCLPWFIINLSLAWSIFPRRNKPQVTGIRISSADHPALFDLIQRVGSQISQVMPDEVYIVPEPNTYVGEYRGWLGFHKKRILGIGLPMLAALDRRQVRAVIAHEFGHFSNGDAILGPWIYSTRMAIERSIGSISTWLQAPFHWYGQLFLRVTLAISRKQELEADRQAALVAGTQVTIDTLKQTELLAPLYGLFTEQEVGYVISRGYYPPLSEGFHLFLCSERIRNFTEAQIQKVMAEDTFDPNSSHPTLPLRIRELASGAPISAAEETGDSLPGTTLLKDLYSVELALMQAVNGPDWLFTCEPIIWSQVGQQVYIPGWADGLKPFYDLLDSFTPATLPEYLAPEHPLEERSFNNSAPHQMMNRSEAPKPSCWVTLCLSACFRLDGR